MLMCFWSLNIKLAVPHENGIALICRANPEQTAWYEFRVSSTAQYAIYRYDAALRDDYKNPYIELTKGVSDAISPTRDNIMRAMCKGTALVLEVKRPGNCYGSGWQPDRRRPGRHWCDVLQ